jgi:2-hydroxy-3-keto-5-methylthiopentenyl-1-phosphate phosphatase
MKGNQERQSLCIILDWDGTVTKHDTLDILAAIGYERNRHQHLTPWDQIVQAYISDYTRHEDLYRPARPDRGTVAQESAWLASLGDVEARSVERARNAGIFDGVTDDDICTAAQNAIRTNKVELRDGWRDIFAMVAGHSHTVSIVSVNWSGTFIRACLSAALEDKGTADSIAISSNHLQPDDPSDPGIRTSADKLDALRKLRDGGKRPVFYVGDSPTDFDCLLAAEVGFCVRDEPMGSGQAELKESLERVGVQVARLDWDAWDEYQRETAGQGFEKVTKVVWWVADLREVVGFAEKYVGI